jgi:uroporphyrinogen decarboxylase
LNARERMIATLDHKRPDRVPIELILRGEVAAALRRHYGVETDVEVARILEADASRTLRLPQRWPEFERSANGELKGHFGSTGPAVLVDERTYRDRWGVVRRVGADGRYTEWVDGPFARTDDLDSFDWPGKRVFTDDDSYAAKVAALKADGYWVNGDEGEHPFRQAWFMRGFENFLCDYVTNPAWVEAIYERILEYTLAACRRSAAAGVDQISFWGDVAMQDRMIVPPERWRALDKPVWRRIIREARKVNPEVRFFFHSDGDIRPIIGDIVEVGFDIINPIQPECMNPALVKREWGSRVTLQGGGSVQRTLPIGTLEDVRREVDFLMTTCAWDGGYVFSTSSSVSFDCPLENVIAYFETARDYDLSTLTGPPDEIPDPPPCMLVKDRPRRNRYE